MVDIPAGTPFVFISYASVNRSRVIEIVDCLESSGIGIWFDRSDIPGGTSYGPEIVSGIKNAAAVVLMCSEASLASRNVRQEIQLAWRHERPILPLLLEPLLFPDDVSYWLEGAQWIEVLDSGPDVWLDQVRYALTLMGYAGLAKRTSNAEPAPSTLVELPPNNLPDAANLLIGRERELRQIRSLLEHARVLTLTGAGGTGKTHLAEQAARESAIHFTDGIWFIDAADTKDRASLVGTIASALEVQEAPGESLIETINARLLDQRTLLILDNLEQNDAAAEVVNLLTSQEGPIVLGTSRAPLHANAEMVVPVAPLESPDLHPDTPASVIARNPAVQLFTERARQVKPDFQLSDGNAFEVASICAKLDGLPLAIELAAARSRLLHPTALLARLDTRLSVLTRGSGRSARQQTLQSTIAWSYDLLGPLEQSVFRRAGVFAGGASVEMAEQVISSVGDDVAHEDILDAVDELIDHSLLELDRSHRDDESTRVRMLETIREYALAMLDETGELKSTRVAHANGFLNLVEELEPQLEAGQQALALSSLSRDQANIITALHFLLASPDPQFPELALRLAGSLWRFWWMRGAFSEGMRLIDSALDTDTADNSPSRAHALNGAGIMAFSMGDLDRARQLHELAAAQAERLGQQAESGLSQDNLGIVSLVSGDVSGSIDHFEAALSIYRDADDHRGIAVALDHLGAANISAGNLQRARELGEQSLAEWKRIGDQRAISQVLQQLGIAAMYSGQYEEARDRYRQSQALAEAQHDPATLATALVNLASATEMLGEMDEARFLLERALELYRQVEDSSRIAYTKYMLGHVARNAGQQVLARTFLADACQQLQTIGQQDAVALCFESMAGLSIDGGDPERAAMLFGAAQQIRDRTGAVVPGTRFAEIEQDVAKSREALGESLYAERFESGRTTDPATLVGLISATGSG